MEKKAVLILMGLLVISIVAASAYAMGFGSRGMNGLQDNEELKSAIEAGGYTAYKTAVESGIRKKVQLTEEQFNKLAEKYRQEAPMIEVRQKISKAIKDKDYSAWADAANSLIELKKAQINQENFDKIVQMHQKMQGNNSTMMHFARFKKGHFWR